MVDTPISKLPDAGSLTGEEVTIISQLSTSITINGTTISALAADNSFNDSANGFVAAGFTVDDYVFVEGFTGNVANNIFSGKITALTAGKMTIGGTDGDVIVDDAAGESVTISKWVSRRKDVADLGGGGGGGGWTDLTFPGASSSKWFSQQWFQSAESITLAAGDKIEILFVADRDAAEFMALCLTPDNDEGLVPTYQNNNEFVFYGFTDVGTGADVSSGTNIFHTWSGEYELRLIVYLGKTGSNHHAVTIANSHSTEFADVAVASYAFAGSSNRVWLLIPNNNVANIVKAKYRINSDERG